MDHSQPAHCADELAQIVPDPVQKAMCSMCDMMYDEKDMGLVQKANPITGAKLQMRCKLCNAAKSCITRMMASHPE